MSDPSLMAQLTKSIRSVARIPRDVTITAETRLFDDLQIDSLDLFAVLVEVQDRFDVLIDVEEMPELNRVGDLAALVSTRQNSAAA